MRIDRIRVRQYAPSTTRPNQPDVQALDWIEPGNSHLMGSSTYDLIHHLVLK